MTNRRATAIKAQWDEIVNFTKRKANAHARVARFWSAVDTMFGLALILSSALTAVMTSQNAIPSGVVVGISCLGTVLASMNSFLKPAKKQHLHHTVSTNFRSLHFQMIFCETDEKYRKLLGDFEHLILEEPLIFPKPSIEHGEHELNQLYQV